MNNRRFRELDDTKRQIRDCIDCGTKTAGVKLVVVLALAIALAMSLLLLGGITRPADAQDTVLRRPDLRMGPLKNFKIREYPDGRRLLRFATILVNVGAGPFELHGQRPDTDTSTMSVTQRIYDDAGGYRDIPTSAVMFFSGDGHDHWHVKNLQRYTLKRLTRGNAVSHGQVRTGAKNGFCVYDVFAYNLTLPRTPDQKQYRKAGTCGEAKEEAALRAKMGLAVGWADEYSYLLPYQWIDITGLPSGTYRLRVEADVGGWFRESREANNYTWDKIEIKGDKVTVLKEGPVARYCGRHGRWC